MEYNYNFTKEEKRILYSELKNIINSKEYKLLRKEYYKLINQVTKNIFYLNLEQPFQIAYLLNNNIIVWLHFMDKLEELVVILNESGVKLRNFNINDTDLLRKIFLWADLIKNCSKTNESI